MATDVCRSHHNHRRHGRPADAVPQAMANLARINIAVTNRITGLFAGWLSGFGILTHVGRKSGKVYRTPVNVFRAPNGFIIALTYSSQCEWVKNVLAAGGCELKTRGKKYRLSAPEVVRDSARRRFPIPVRVVLRVVGADEYMELSIPAELSGIA
jgi:deazaflavin-dependent oxidoreductase (nitroreductase family)